MGKKSKLVNEDPILSKNFKYEKRKKERLLQKEAQKRQKQQQAQAEKELRQIEQGVNQKFLKMYEEEKKKIESRPDSNLNNREHLLKMNPSKSKLIQKKAHFESGILKPSQLFKSFPSYAFKREEEDPNYQINFYIRHYQKPLSREIQQGIHREVKVSEAKKMEKDISGEIKNMFGTWHEGTNQATGKFKPIQQQGEQEIDLQGNQDNKMDQQADKNSENQPYVLLKQFKKQIEILIEEQPFGVSKLFQKNTLPEILQNKKQPTQSDQSPSDESSFTQNTQKIMSIVESYSDYVHIENKEEQTIQTFRKCVLNHMHNHFDFCFNKSKRTVGQVRGEESRSKGFTNGKFLILTPYFGDARAIFDLIEEQFTVSESEGTEGDTIGKQKWTVQNKERIDSEEIENENDFFRVGLRIFQKKRIISYFSNFDSSDFLIASPLGLKSIISGDSHNKSNFSFLSSVQILYIDRASVLSMQNFDHLQSVLSCLNLMPKYQSVKNSISQIREHHLEMMGRIYRQNIVFSEFFFPEINALKMNHFHNWSGCLTLKHVYQPLEITENADLQRQFYKIELKEPKDDLEVRFDFFKRKFFENIHNKDSMNRIVVFVNSYFEFVKLKAHFEKTNASAEYICEHTRKQKIQSRISNFNNGKFRILLLTQRAYFFGLCQIKRLKYIFFYSLPKNMFIFREIIGSIIMKAENQRHLTGDEDLKSRIISIYSKYDKMILERIVGTKKSIEMVKEYCSNVSFIV